MWNYRLIRDDSGYIRVHEVFYTKKRKIWGWSEAIDLGGAKRKDIIGDLEYIMKDIKKSEILDESWLRENCVKPKWMKKKGTVEYLELGEWVIRFLFLTIIYMNTLETLKAAIINTQQLSFRYIKEGKNEGIRIGNPYAVFIFTSKTGEQSTKVHIVQTEGVSDSKETNPFPSFRMYNIEDLAEAQILTDRPKFEKPYHESYNSEWDGYKDVIKKI